VPLYQLDCTKFDIDRGISRETIDCELYSARWLLKNIESVVESVCRAGAKTGPMAIAEGGPQTPENSARDEAIPTVLGRRRNPQAETLQAPVIEFPSLDDGKRITNQMIASLVISLRKAVTQQTSIIKAARAEIQEIKTEQKALKEQNTELQEEVQTLRAQIETQGTANPPPKSWAEVAATNSPYNTNTIIR
jgi:predicted RecB family endonuclease